MATCARSAPAAVDQRCINCDIPKLGELLEELEQITNWQLFMIKLDMEKHKTDKIELNHPNNIDRQKQDAFDLWLRQTPDASWKSIVDALYRMEENTLANKLSKKYTWKDPRPFVKANYFVPAAPDTCLTAQPIGDVPCRKYLPPIEPPWWQYYTLEDDSFQPVTRRQVEGAANHFSGIIKRRQGDTPNVFDVFKNIEESDCKESFKIGLEARFGKVYWKMDPSKVLSPGSRKGPWLKSKLLRKCAFNTEVEHGDVRQLLVGKHQLGRKATNINLDFCIVEGRDVGIYRALIANYESKEMFYLDAVYREQNKARTRINLAFPGRKYDVRISDCSECVLLEREGSIPYRIAMEITSSMTRLDGRKLHLILRGETPKRESSWKVNHIRQRVQTQYSWKPEKKWILAHYEVDVFQRDDQEKSPMPDVDDAPLNKPVDLPDFDYSRVEVELWGQKVFPKHVNNSELSKNKYYYPEGVCGVKLPGGEERPPYNWTTEDLMKDFDEFLADTFEIAHILSGCY